MTLAKGIKAIAQAQKLQNEVLKEQIEILKAFSEFEDERFNKNYEKAVKTASLQRKMILNDALAANGVNFMLGDHNNIPDKDFSRVVGNYKEAAKTIDDPLDESDEVI